MHEQHLSISLENFVGGERFNEVIVQVAAVRALLDVAVLGEILHPDSNIHHRLPAVFTVETSLRTHTEGCRLVKKKQLIQGRTTSLSGPLNGFS